MGESGSGKSTIIKLIAGLETPWAGQLLFDVVPRRNIDPHVLHLDIGFFDYLPSTFFASIYDNIALWDDTVDAASVEKAVSSANAYALINKRPKGFEDLVVESGKSLSAGEVQRLALSRLFIRRPQIILLDKALSSLDQVNKRIVLKNIIALPSTVLMVSDDPEILSYIDRIIYLDQGKIIADGSFDVIQPVLAKSRIFNPKAIEGDSR